MQLVFDTSLKGVCFPAKIKPPGDTHVAVAKATIDLVPGRTARLAAEQAEIEAWEILYEDDLGNSCRYPGDVQPFKPVADLLLTGTCHAPRGRARHCDVTFAVGAWSKTLRVFGNRYWIVGDGGERLEMTQARPFASLPLRYELTIGAASDAANPHGCGTVREYTAEGEAFWRLPNIEHPDAPITDPRDRPPPAGFTPLSFFLPDRLNRRGTFDEAWMARRRPFPPEDVDWAYCNAAPPDQRYDGYLQGDEVVRLVNMHPSRPVIETRLPGLRPRFFVLYRDGEAQRGREVSLKLDTLWVDADALRAVLLWRGRIRLPDGRSLDDDVGFLIDQRPGEAPLRREQVWQRYVEATAPPPPEPPAEPIADDEKQARIDGFLAEALARLRKGGAPADMLDALAKERDPKRFETLMLSWSRSAAGNSR